VVREAFDDEVLSRMNINVSPNPTNGTTTFTMDLQEAGNLSISLIDINGNEILSLHNAQTDAGTFTKTFSMAKLTRATYYISGHINGKAFIVPVVMLDE